MMKKFIYLLLVGTTISFTSCGDDDDVITNDDDGGVELGYTGESKTYVLDERAVDGISGVAIFRELEGGLTEVTLDLEGTPDGGVHPAHIHAGNAADGGPIVVTFNPVDGDTGESVTIVSGLNTDDDDDDDEAISYDQLLEYDGYINVHLSADDLATLVAQGDIGQNELTGVSKVYELEERAVEGISGTATFEERRNGETLVTLALEGTPEDGEHPAHIHLNSAAEGGAIVVTFNPVNGATGLSVNNVSGINTDDDDDDDEDITYEQLLDFDGYINVHLSSDELGTLVAQGDIGSNELTGEEKVYELEERAVDGISGTATFQQRRSGETLVTLALEGTPEDGEHPAHIHFNSAAEGGAIAVSFNPVNGATGLSVNNVSGINLDDDDDDNDEDISYDQLLDFDGYINVHLSSDELGTIVAQGDIGSNELTGEERVYELEERDVDGISGTATFQQRISGETLVTLALVGTPDGGEHPAHIHMNSAAEGGPIVVTFNPVNGTTGMSQTHVSALNADDDDDDNDEDISYEQLLGYDGYINVHLSAEDLATLVAQGDIGSNVD